MIKLKQLVGKYATRNLIILLTVVVNCTVQLCISSAVIIDILSFGSWISKIVMMSNRKLQNTFNNFILKKKILRISTFKNQFFQCHYAILHNGLSL